MKKLQKIMAALLAIAMTFSFTACSPNAENNFSKTSSEGAKETVSKTPEGKTDGEVTNLTLLTVGAGLTEEEDSLVMHEAAKKTGIFVQQTVVDEEKFSILMASGDMETDIIAYNKDLKSFIEGEIIVPLDDLIEQYGPDIKANIPDTLKFSKKYGSFGRDKIYSLRSQNISYDDFAKERPFNYGIAPFIRWDYYEELGKPAVTNEDEFLALLKKMQEKHPTADDKQTYPMSLTLTDLWNIFTFYSLCGDTNYLGQGYAVSRNSKNEISGNILETDYAVWNTFKYYYKANQMGILDPESFTQKGENVTEKATTGRLFYTENSWNNWNSLLAESVGPQAGFEALIDAFPSVYGGDCGNYGWGYTMSIPEKSENKEAAMKWMNFMYSFDGARLLYNGIEGVHWDYDANKKPVLREETIKMYQDKEWGKTNGLRKFANWIGIALPAVHPDGGKVDLFADPDMLLANNLEIDKKYSEYYGVDFPGQAPDGLAKKGSNMGKAVFWPSDAVNMMPPTPDNLIRIATKVNDALLKVSSRIILAKSDAEFDSIRDETIKQIKSMGVQEIIDWTTTEFERAKQKLQH